MIKMNSIIWLTIFLVLSEGFILYAQFGKGDIVFKVNGEAGNVVFQHKVHAGSQHITCEYCHDTLMRPYIEQAREQGKKLAEVVDKLFCNSCHNGQKAFSTDDKLSCNKCHSVVEKKNNGKKISN
jgi:c(7)-type cytochrome triheme protein